MIIEKPGIDMLCPPLKAEKVMSRKIIFLIFLTGTVCILISACDAFIGGSIFGVYNEQRVSRNYLATHASTTEMDKQAKKMVAPEHKALVYYYYQSGIDIAHYSDYKLFTDDYRLFIDNKCISGNIRPPGFFVWLLPPGVHTVESQQSKLVLNVIGGETYFIQQKAKYSYGKYIINMEIIDKETGRKHIEESRLLIANAADECGPERILSPADDVRMKNMTTSEDSALVYLYRNPDEYNNHNEIVRLGEGSDVEIAAGTYLLWQVRPGAHIIESAGSKLTIDAKAGAIYYIRVGVNHRWYGALHGTLQFIDNEEGYKCIKDSVPMTETPVK